MTTTGGERRTILVVDSNDGFFRHTELALRQVDSRLSSIQQPDGRQGLDFLSRCRPGGIPVPAAVLVDRLLPGELDGFAVVRGLRRLESLEGVLVLVCCGSDDPEHVFQAREAGANGCLKRPVLTDGFPEFARQICLHLQENWRRSGGSLSEGSLALRQTALQSAPNRAMSLTTAIPAHTLPNTSSGEENAFLRTFQAIQDLIVRTFDPVDYAINQACRKHCIPVAHARGRGGDYITTRNRHRVILDLMRQGYGDRVILDNFQLSQRNLERLREEWRGENGGGSLAAV